jgi:hypothetical protein
MQGFVQITGTKSTKGKKARSHCEACGHIIASIERRAMSEWDIFCI